MKGLYISIISGALIVASCGNNENKNSSTTNIDSGTQQRARPQTTSITQVASFKGVQVTGVTISENGRLFANFPRWRDSLPFSVVEIMPDGSYKPYPDTAWNNWNGQPQENRFTCVQSVVAHGNSLFVLDPASPMFKGVIGNAVLYEFDLPTNTLKNKWVFDKQIAPSKSYLNDLRVDDKTGRIYITDSGLGGIVVLYRNTGRMVRLLDNHPSTKSENIVLTIDGKQWLRNGNRPQVHSDGIALYNDSVYYHALTGYTLYRVPTSALTSESAATIASQVENLGKTPAPDGMIFDKAGNLYMADLERNAIVYRTPDGKIKMLIESPEIKWADTFTIDKEGSLYFTTSRLHETNGNISNMEFNIYKIRMPR